MTSATENYTLNTYADGYGNWHCEIVFKSPMGNTNYASSIIVNAIRQAKRNIREEIVVRSARNAQIRRLKYKVAANKMNNQNQLTYLEIVETA